MFLRQYFLTSTVKITDQNLETEKTEKGRVCTQMSSVRTPRAGKPAAGIYEVHSPQETRSPPPYSEKRAVLSSLMKRQRRLLGKAQQVREKVRKQVR